ncbi:MAG: PilZ domain-containing protein [Thermodesulfobacteriota bacterium]
MTQESAAPADRRRFHRLRVQMAVEYAALPAKKGELCQGHGVLQDISLSGVYFHCDPQVPLKSGQTLTLSIAASLPGLDPEDTSQICATGEIVRLDPPRQTDSPCGVAIKFSAPPTFFTSANLD